MTAERLPPVDPATYTDAQKQAAATFQAMRGNPPFGPFAVMIRSPELMVRVQAVGEYLRFHSPLSPRLREFATLMIAREWSQDYEWHIHHPLALKDGVSAETAEAIRQGRRPDGMTAEEALVYDAGHELLRTKRLSDATYAALRAHFSEAEVLDLIAVFGIYTMLAMTLNVARTAAPPYLPRFPE
jgi:4-carboxymuconolactone decarboxylase